MAHLHAAEWIAIGSGVVALGAAGISIWQAKVAAASARHSQRQAEAADEQARVAREQLQQAEHSHQEQLALSQWIHREQSEPYVVVDIATVTRGSGMLVLIIEHVGPTVARDVRIRFTPEIESSEASLTPRLHRALARPVSVLPPGRHLVYAFDSHRRWSTALPMEYNVTVDTLGPAGPVEQLTYRIDLVVLTESLVGERPHKTHRVPTWRHRWQPRLLRPHVRLGQRRSHSRRAGVMAREPAAAGRGGGLETDPPRGSQARRALPDTAKASSRRRVLRTSTARR